MKARDERTFIRVHDGIEDHPKVVVLSDGAFRLLVTTWGWCSKHLTDGRVPLAVWRKRGTARARKELLDGNLAHLRDDHVQMHDYLDHQRSAADVEVKRQEKRDSGLKGAHARWHPDRSKADPKCRQCIANGWHEPWQQPSQELWQTDGEPMAEVEVETEVEKELPVVTRGGGVPLADARGNPHPQERPSENCQRHPDGTRQPCGGCADARRTAEAWDTRQDERRAEVAAELEAARADPRNRCEHGTDGGRVLHPDTQLPLCALCRARQRLAAS